jgi:predicted ABC-type ATPase
MSGEAAKRLRMFAGPNGSGKSSIIRNLAKEQSANGLFWLRYYLNADNVQRALASTGLDFSDFNIDVTLADLMHSLRDGGRVPDDHSFFASAQLNGTVLTAPKGNGYLAASIVDFIRTELMRRGESFSFETVMSHRSKVDFFAHARAEGYKTYLYFVCTNSADLNVARVRSRVETGGHPVPEDKIRERYTRCLELACEAIKNSYRAYFFDNSGRETIWVAEFDPQGNCDLKIQSDELPQWFRTWIWERLSPEAQQQAG